MYVNFIDVGYYNNQSDLTNSFQIIITSPESGVLPDGNNAQVCYLDMNWAHGDVGGSGGCCGPDPGVTGADGESTNPNPATSPHVQFGRFNLPDDTYNGPYGIGEGNDDGINWLDYKFFNINTALTNNNLAPVPTANLGCDTISLCLGQTTSLDVEFLGPEPTQTVDLEVTETLAGSCEIVDFNVSNGSTATFTGTFVANSPGLSTVTMSATDSEGMTTAVDIVINVLDIVPPEIEVSTLNGGEFGICAGAELEVIAESIGGQEPIADWSWNLNSQFWSENEATIPFGGNFVVTGETAGGCVVKETFQVVQTPFYLPTVEGTLQAVCPGDSAYVEVIPDADENFVSYTWVGDWNGGGGEVLSSNGAGAWLTAGVYQVIVEDEGGCEGKRTFIMAPSASTIPEVTVDPLCGEAAFDTISFNGGYSSPAEGYLSLYLYSTLNGWDGSFLSVDIIHEDGTVTNSTITLNSGNFANVNNDPDLAIVYGDSVQVTYVSNDPSNDQFFSIDIFNCVTNCISNPDGCSTINDLSTGVVYYGPALCTVQPAFGTWDEASGLGNNSFSVTDQYNTTWSATDYGLYELCFTDAECGTATCYDVEVNLPPTIELSGDSLVWCVVMMNSTWRPSLQTRLTLQPSTGLTQEMTMCCSMNIRGRSIRHQPWWSAWKMDAVRRRTKWRSRRCLNLFWKTTICAEKVGHLNLTPFQGTKTRALSMNGPTTETRPQMSKTTNGRFRPRVLIASPSQTTVAPTASMKVIAPSSTSFPPLTSMCSLEDPSPIVTAAASSQAKTRH